ncbi:MAG: hypothetical protein PSX81_12980 [bacterium]|nr:hypothetical protein [bacterium]
MESIFDSSANAKLLSRIDSLTPQSQALWGKMTVDKMLAHCQQSFRSAKGELNLKRNLIGFLFGKMIKKKMIADDAPLVRNSPTEPHFIITDNRDFETEKTKLKVLISEMSERGSAAIGDQTHPFFGPMSTSDWDVLLMKHTDHHLRQFGV